MYASPGSAGLEAFGMSFDFDKFLNAPLMNVYGQQVSFLSQRTGKKYSVIGIFDRTAIRVENNDLSPDPYGSVSSNESSLSIRLKNWPVYPEQNDAVWIEDIKYEIFEIQKDGTGEAKLILKWFEQDDE